MDDFQREYNKLNFISKRAINAYRSGRQFMVTGINTSFGVTLDRLYPTIISSLVNEIFACELFLKSLYMIKHQKEMNKIHKLFDLYEAIEDNEIKNKMTNYDFIDELKKINSSFITWRYCYEYNSLIINRKFVFDFCKILEEKNREVIFEKYNIDMTKSFI